MGKALHDSDLVRLTVRSAELLRAGEALNQEEREQTADELDCMAASTRRELRSCTVSLLMHLLEIEFQPERRSRGWDLTVANHTLHLDVAR